MAPGEQQQGHPPYVRDLLLYPNLGDPVARSAGAISLFAEVRPASAGRLAARLGIVGPDGPLAPIPVTLAAPDAVGRIQQLLLPIGSMPAGDYVVRFTVEQTTSRVVREARVNWSTTRKVRRVERVLPRESPYDSPMAESPALRFTAVFRAVPEGFIAFVEELPGANAQGATLEEARANLREAVALVIEANRELAGQDLAGADVIREPFVVRP